MDLGFGLAYIRQEGCAIHPDDTDADYTDDQYLRQLRAYHENNDAFKVPCSRPELLAKVSAAILKPDSTGI